MATRVGLFRELQPPLDPLDAVIHCNLLARLVVAEVHIRASQRAD